MSKGITYLENGTKSENRLWLKLDRNFFDFDKDLYICSVYIPPINSNYYENDFESLENEISTFANRGKILLVGDFNSRTGTYPDYIITDSLELNDFCHKNILPSNYLIDYVNKRNNQDKIFNNHGKNLLPLCISFRLRILNGRFVGDSLGFFTCLTANGLSCVDYAILSESLLSSVLYFITEDFDYFSDHAQIKVILKCNIKKDKFDCSPVLSNWREIKGYKWAVDSSEKIIDALSSEKIMSSIIDFERKYFSNDQKGVDEATEVLNSIFCDIADQSCKIVRCKKPNQKKKIIKQKWSDYSIYEQKKTLNLMCSQLRKDPFNNILRQRYFFNLKSFRKNIKQKKQEYKAQIFAKLSNCLENNSTEFWKILRSIQDKEADQQEGLEELLTDIDKTTKFIQDQGRCSDENRTFENKINNEFKKLGESLVYNSDTDKPISITEIKKSLIN